MFPKYVKKKVSCTFTIVQLHNSTSRVLFLYYPCTACASVYSNAPQAYEHLVLFFLKYVHNKCNMTRSTKIRPFIQEGEIKASSGSITLTNPSPLSIILKLHILVNHTILLNLKCAQNPRISSCGGVSGATVCTFRKIHSD